MNMTLIAITPIVLFSLVIIVCVLNLDLTSIELRHKDTSVVMKANGKHFDSRPTKSKSKCPKKKKS